jgi:hypothetical protein
MLKYTRIIHENIENIIIFASFHFKLKEKSIKK